MTDEVYTALRSYLERLGAAEYAAFKAGNPGKRQKYQPTPYHRTLVILLGKGDEQAFKAFKAEQGYTSALGC